MSKVKQLIDELKSKGRPGRPPKITPCPFCGSSMSQTEHSKHRAKCAQNFRGAPPQSAELAQDPGGGYNKDGTLPQT